MPIAYGTLAERPVEGTNAGDPYIATDTHQTFIWSGTEWIFAENFTQTEHDVLPHSASLLEIESPEGKYLRDDGTWQNPPGGSEAFPVGSVFIAVVDTNPNTLLGYGTWSAFGAGRVLVGLDSGDADFDTAEEIGGEKTHTLTEAEMPAHTHNENAPTSASGGAVRFATDTNANGSTNSTLDTGSSGSGNAHNNVQPYIVVYMWKRMA